MAKWGRKPIMPSVHPVLHALERALEQSPLTQPEITKKAGVTRNALVEWRHNGRDPRLGSIDAVLNVLGYKLAVVPL